MNLDKAFKGLPRIVQLLLLIIPFVGWLTEILVRLSSFLRDKDSAKIVGLLLYILPTGQLLAIIDFVLVLLGKDMLLA